MKSGIYRIVHEPTGREYIGQSCDIRRRWRAHRRKLNLGKHHSPQLQFAWLKHGPSEFKFEIIEACEEAILDASEQYYLNNRKPIFNTAKFARTRRGVPHSQEARAKISAKLKGRRRSPAECHNISCGLRGLRHSPETRAKMRNSALGRKMSSEALLNMSKAQRKRKRPPEEYASRKGRKRPLDVIQRSAAARRGSKRTPEQIERLKKAANAMPPEKRAKIAQARRDAIKSRGGRLRKVPCST